MKEKILQRVAFLQTNLLYSVAFLAIAFFLGSAQISGGFSPFCVAFCIAAPSSVSIFALVGGIAGSLVFSGFDALVYISALAIGVSVKLLFHLEKPMWAPILSGVSLGATKVLSMLILPVGLGTWLLEGAEVVLCASLSYLFVCAVRGWDKPHRGAAELSGIGVFLVSLLLSFCSFSAFGLNLGRFVAALITAEAAMVAGASGGAMVGLIAAISLSLFTRDFALFGGVLAASGFLSGIFKPMGRAVQACVFAGMFLLCAAFLGGLQLQNLGEVAVSCAVAAVVPVRLFDRFFRSPVGFFTHTDSRLTDELSMKLEFTARTLLDLQENVKECAERLDSAAAPDLSHVYHQAADQVCRGCGLNTFCWVTAHRDFQRALDQMTERLREDGNIHAGNLPAFFRQKCCRLPDLVQVVNLGYRDFVSKKQAARRVGEARAIATEQFAGMSDLLLEMSEELADVARVDEEAAVQVKNLLRDRGLHGTGISCLIDRFDRMTIDLYLDVLPPRSELTLLQEELSDVLDRELEEPSVMKANRKVKVSFFEAASLRVDFAAAQSAHGGGGCCGDSYDFFMDSKGFAHIVLSDGMGTGKRAALDSVMTCSTMRRLIQSGFGFTSAFKLMNLSFAIKSPDESLATVDTCTIDLYTGRTQFVKAGAAASFVSKSGHMMELSSASLPIGIIQGVPYDKSDAKLSRGDMIVMVTDGATTSGSEWILAEMKLLAGKRAKEIAQNLLSDAKRRSLTGHDDDITVLVARIV